LLRPGLPRYWRPYVGGSFSIERKIRWGKQGESRNRRARGSRTRPVRPAPPDTAAAGAGSLRK